jgi:hypothetical protein
MQIQSNNDDHPELLLLLGRIFAILCTRQVVVTLWKGAALPSFW